MGIVSLCYSIVAILPQQQVVRVLVQLHQARPQIHQTPEPERLPLLRSTTPILRRVLVKLVPFLDQVKPRRPGGALRTAPRCVQNLVVRQRGLVVLVAPGDKVVRRDESPSTKNSQRISLRPLLTSHDIRLAQKIFVIYQFSRRV